MPFAAAAAALPALLGGAGGSTKVSTSISNPVTLSVSPGINVSLGGGINSMPTSRAGVQAPATAYTSDIEPDLRGLGLGQGVPATYDGNSAIPVTGSVMNGDMILYIALAAGAYFLLKGG